MIQGKKIVSIEIGKSLEAPKRFRKMVDIYSGEETIRFNNRHPIYKSLMKIEFEEVLRKYHKLTLIE